jgi:3-deoxy-D-arabino-heptulosonate 7-phosphate (DAHP) synthase
MAMAGMAAGADGIIVEVHPDPDSAMCDASQTITPATLEQIHRGVEALRLALDPIFAPAAVADRLVAVAD